MAEYQCARTAYTPTATADNVAYTANGFEAYVAAAAPAIARINEVMEGGEATSSTVNVMALRRDSTATATPTAKTPQKLNPSSPANGGTYHQTGTTPGTPANATHLLNLSLNVFGGIVRWVAAPGQEIYLIGGSSGNSEAGLSAVSGTPGAMSSHFIVEEL